MKTIVMLFCLASVAGAAEGWPTHPVVFDMASSCGIPAGFFLNASIGMPKANCRYPLAEAVVFQKVKGGYLLRSSYDMGETEAGTMFLKTADELPQGLRFDGTAHVKWTGTYSYMGLDGFKNTVWKFERAEGQ